MRQWNIINGELKTPKDRGTGSIKNPDPKEQTTSKHGKNLISYR